MNIILGKPGPELDEKFVVLPLDTFLLPDIPEPVVAYCVIGDIPLIEFAAVEIYKQVHHDLIRAYQDQNWEYCNSAIEGLMGKWNGALDSFYRDLSQRVAQAAVSEGTWTHIIDKSQS